MYLVKRVIIIGVLFLVKGILCQLIAQNTQESVLELTEMLKQENRPLEQMDIYARLADHFKYKGYFKSKAYLAKGNEIAQLEGAKSDQFYFMERKAMFEVFSGNYLQALHLYDEALQQTDIQNDTI